LTDDARFAVLRFRGRGRRPASQVRASLDAEENSPMSPAEMTSQPSPASMAGRRAVLFADNEALVLQLARTILSREGYPVLEARDGSQAVEVFRRWRTSIAVVVLDFSMPQLSGPAALEELIRIDPEVRVVMTSGGEVEDLPAATRRSLRGFLPKPFSREQLLRAVAEALRPEAENGPAGG
jgi:DNA-binding NtrC family response regulator